MGVECLVGLLDMPCCLDEISPCLDESAWEKPGLAGEPCVCWLAMCTVRVVVV
jgi:hypothetical protein